MASGLTTPPENMSRGVSAPRLNHLYELECLCEQPFQRIDAAQFRVVHCQIVWGPVICVF